ncbi:MAG: ATP-binding protein [Solibacillus isronensis]
MTQNNNQNDNNEQHNNPVDGDSLKKQFAEAYNADAIGGDRGLLGIRSSPSWYLGSASAGGARQALIEILQNGVDEGAAFLNFLLDNGLEVTKEDFIRIKVKIDKEDGVEITDTGRGVPPDHHPKYGVPIMQVVFEETNIGGKGKGFVDESKSAYKTPTIGKHGSGAACANATSDYFYVTSRFMRDDKVFTIEWEYAVRTQNLMEQGSANGERGTTVAFKPSKEVFKLIDDSTGEPVTRYYSYEWLEGLITEYAYNVDGIIFEIEFEEEGGTVKTLELDSSEMTAAKRLGVAEEQVNKVSFADDVEGYKLDLYLTTEGPFNQISSVNMLPIKIGTHIDSMNEVLSEIEREFIPLIQDQLKNMGVDFDVNQDNLRMIGVPKLTSFVRYYMSLNMASPDYSGQSKERLTVPQIKKALIEGIKTNIDEHLVDFKVAIAEKFFKTVIALASNYVRMKSEEASLKEQEEVKEMQKQIKKKKKAGIKGMSDDFNQITRAREQNLSKVILYIFEGSSAYNGGLAVRYPQNETMFAINRRPINVFKYSFKQLRSSDKFNILYELLHGDKGQADYSAVVLASDPDEDGELINLYMLALISRFFPDYIRQGKVLIFQAYKYIAIPHKDELAPKLFREEQDCRDFINAHNGEYYMSQFKGLGSIPNNLLRTTLDDTDNYLRIDPNSLKDGLPVLERALMSTGYKQRYVLSKHGSLGLNLHYIDRKRILKNHEIDYDVNDLENGFTVEPDMSQTRTFRTSKNLISPVDELEIDLATSHVIEAVQSSLSELEELDPDTTGDLDGIEDELYEIDPESDIDIE